VADGLPDGSYALSLHDQSGQLIGHIVYRKIGRRIKTSLLDSNGTHIEPWGNVDAVLMHEELLTAWGNRDQDADLAKIAQNPEEFAIKFGLLTGRCGVCNRKLTNPESRERGIGPECLRKIRASY
jgi:hypothetical protein